MNKLLLLTAFIVVLLSCACAPGGCGKESQARLFEAWPVPIEVRVYRGAFTREPGSRQIKLEGLAGECLSAQVAVRSNRDIKGLTCSPTDLTGQGGAKIPSSAARVRYGAFVPVDETLVLTADPLLEEESVDVPANLAQPVWITLKVPRNAVPGLYNGKFTLSAASGGQADFDVSVEVLPAVLPEPPDWTFHLNLWQSPTPVAHAHKVKLWSEKHWQILERYAENFAAHGMKAIMTHIIHDPWDSVRGFADDTMVEWKYPGEPGPGNADKFEWDFTAFDRYVELMMKAGVKRSIDLYALVMGPGGTLKADILYLDTITGEYRTAEMKVGDPLWRECWSAFLPVLRKHLKEKGWFDKAVLGFDEKPENVMRVIFDFIASEAPDFKVASSGGYPGDEHKWADEIVFHIREFQDRNRWLEIEPVVRRMHREKYRYVTFYTACRPHYPNTFIFSSLRETRLLPWLAWKYGFDGYIRWAVNLFPEDPWNQPMFTWPSGDMFFIWPGKEGPLDSMRWELLRQGIQDYEALRIARELAEKAGRDDLLDKLRRAVRTGTIIDSCRWIPYIEQARAIVNEVIRELGTNA